MKQRTTLLLNWYANPYHAPIFIAKALGYYEDVGINLAILEPTDPSDVTEIAGLGNVDIALKAMIHTVAGIARGFPVKSIGTLLDEPPTGLISLKQANITKFSDIIGKKVGYIGHFGKRIIDNLAQHAGIDPNSYTTVKIGMNVVDAILDGKIDTGIGFSSFQQVELAARSGQEALMLRIDQLAGLGCCCFCSIQFIMNQRIIDSDPEMVRKFLFATRRGMDLVINDQDKAFDILCSEKPHLRNEIHRKVFMYTLPLFSRTLLNVDRDWQKVFRYTRHLGIIPEGFCIESCYTNDYVPETPHYDVAPLACCAA